MEAETIAERDAQAGDGGAKRRQIMDGARAVFLSDGFDGASMNDIARAAGVSKGTLYAYFDSKEQLFEALIREDRSQQAERLCSLPVDRSDPRALLGALGHRLIEVMTRPETIAHVRVVIAATAKFPRLGRAFYEAGPLYGTQKLAAQLDAFVESGSLEIADTQRAARQFLDLCQSGVHKPLLFGVVDSVAPSEIDAAVDAAVDVFLKAYRASPTAAPPTG
ncbi:MAG: TetR/AcrR family transcriptional regulator [Roseiarcus sp.]